MIWITGETEQQLSVNIKEHTTPINSAVFKNTLNIVYIEKSMTTFTTVLKFLKYVILIIVFFLQKLYLLRKINWTGHNKWARVKTKYIFK